MSEFNLLSICCMQHTSYRSTDLATFG